MLLNHNEIQFLSAMRAAVLERGYDHTYDETEQGDNTDYSCTYVNYRDGGNSGSCLIGRGLIDSGLVPVSVMEGNEGFGAHVVIPATVPDIGSLVYMAAGKGQEMQDAGKPWGDAYRTIIGSLISRGVQIPEDLLLP